MKSKGERIADAIPITTLLALLEKQLALKWPNKAAQAAARVVLLNLKHEITKEYEQRENQLG